MKIEKNDEAFTGLEAAIVLIAFVVVAAVFSYVMLGAGFFTTQKSQEVIHAGVSQSSTNLEVKGEVYGIGSTSQIDYIRFALGLAPGGNPVDMNKTTMVYSDSTSSVPKSLALQSTSVPYTTMPDSSNWTIYECTQVSGYVNTNTLLEGGEQMTIYVHPIAGTGGIGTSVTFNIEIKPAAGASFFIRRTTPDGLSSVQMLH